MFPCNYIALKASSCVIFTVIFATRASIVCIDSCTCDTIRVSLALTIWFFDLSIDRYTPTFDWESFKFLWSLGTTFTYVDYL